MKSFSWANLWEISLWEDTFLQQSNEWHKKYLEQLHVLTQVHTLTLLDWGQKNGRGLNQRWDFRVPDLRGKTRRDFLFSPELGGCIWHYRPPKQLRDFSEVTDSINSTQYVRCALLLRLSLVISYVSHNWPCRDPTVEQAHILLILINYFTIVTDHTLFPIFTDTETNITWD